MSEYRPYSIKSMELVIKQHTGQKLATEIKTSDTKSMIVVENDFDEKKLPILKLSQVTKEGVVQSVLTIMEAHELASVLRNHCEMAHK